jgi:hypothetical protein
VLANAAVSRGGPEGRQHAHVDRGRRAIGARIDRQDVRHEARDGDRFVRTFQQLAHDEIGVLAAIDREPIGECDSYACHYNNYYHKFYNVATALTAVTAFGGNHHPRGRPVAKKRRRSKGPRRAARRSRLTKRQRAARKAARTRMRNKAARSRRAKKANRTRRRRHGKGKHFGAAREPAAKSPRRRGRRRRRNPAAAEGAEMPKRRRTRRRSHAAAPRGWRKSRRSGKWYKKRRRSRSRRRAAPKRRRVSAKRRAAGRKAARTRRLRRAKTSHMGYSPSDYGSEGRRRRHRRHRRHHSGESRHMARMPNPTSGGMEFGAAIVGVMLGGLATVLADRFTATHALTVSGTSVQDSPAAGQVYNYTAPVAAIWKNPIRLAVAGVSVVVPFIIAKMVKGNGAKSFFQLWGFAALTVTVTKAGTDAAAMLLGAQTAMSGIFPRLFAPEIDASNAADYVKTATNALAAYTLQAGGSGPGTTYGLSATSKTLGAPGGANYVPPENRGGLPHATPVIPGITAPPQSVVPPGGGYTPPVVSTTPTAPIPVNTGNPIPVTTSEGDGTTGETDTISPDGDNPDPWACPPYRTVDVSNTT